MKYQQGFSMTEVLLASGVMTIAAFSAASMMTTSFKTNEHSKKTLVSNQIYNQVIEEIQSANYQQLTLQGVEPAIPLGQNKVTILDSTSKTVSLDRSVQPQPSVTGDVVVVGSAPNAITYPRYVKMNNVEYRIDLLVEKGAYNHLASLPTAPQTFMKDLRNYLIAPAMAASNGNVSITVGPATSGYKNTTVFDFSATCESCPPEKHRTYKWNFGVGEGSSFDANPSKVFTQSTGTQKVYLTVGDKRFSDVALTAEASVTIKDSSVNITMNPTKPQVGQNVTFSASCGEGANSDCGDFPEYHWTFGDGSSASGQSVTHIYAESADYTTTVSVTGGADPTATQQFKVEPKAGNKSVLLISPKNSGVAGPADNADTTQFEITLASEGYENANNVTYTIDFGDNTEPVTVVDQDPSDNDFPKVTHSYEQGGTYKVSMASTPAGITASDGGPLTSMTSTNIVAASQLNMTATQTHVNVGETVYFEASTLGAGDNPEYNWDFGDSKGMSQDFSGYAGHAFTKPGVYTVTVTATGGSNPSTAKEITVLDPLAANGNQSQMKKVHVKVAPWSDAPPSKYLSNAVLFKAQNGGN